MKNNIKIYPLTFPYLYKNSESDDLIFLVMGVRVIEHCIEKYQIIDNILRVNTPLFFDGNSFFHMEKFLGLDSTQKYKIFLEKILSTDFSLTSDSITSPGLRYSLESLKENFKCINIIDKDPYISNLLSRFFYGKIFKSDIDEKENTKIWILTFLMIFLFQTKDKIDDYL